MNTSPRGSATSRESKFSFVYRGFRGLSVSPVSRVKSCSRQISPLPNRACAGWSRTLILMRFRCVKCSMRGRCSTRSSARLRVVGSGCGRGRRDVRDRRPGSDPGPHRPRAVGGGDPQARDHQGVDVANVTHLGRSPTIAQRVALWWRSPECTREGCTRPQDVPRLGTRARQRQAGNGPTRRPPPSQLPGATRRWLIAQTRTGNPCSAR